MFVFLGGRFRCADDFLMCSTWLSSLPWWTMLNAFDISSATMTVPLFVWSIGVQTFLNVVMDSLQSCRSASKFPEGCRCSVRDGRMSFSINLAISGSSDIGLL